MKNFAFFTILPVLALISCNEGTIHLEEKGKLQLKEVSGLEYIPNSGLWAVEDSGNENKIYHIDEKGNTINSYIISNATNTDWEELASDNYGNLYIGDFGNNNNKRRDLAIYKLNAGKYDSVVSKIEFWYPEQKAFPPKKSEMFFDAEAFIEYKGNFLLFTKNRSKEFDGTFNVYSIPNKEGKHEARLIATLKACGNYNKCAITGADISPDGTKLVLLSGDKVWLIDNFSGDNFTQENLQPLELGHFSQKEGICFKDDDTLLIADEKDKHIGGRLYEVKLSALLK